MKPELIAPAGDWVSLRSAIQAKADAVYFGIKELNMRVNAKNFRLSEIKNVVELCHENKIKAYLALNTIVYDNEVKKIKKILKKAKKAKVDAIIAWDFSVIKECEKLNLPIHLSTQASISNFEALSFLKNKIKNIKRVVLAREVSLEQIKEIIKKIRNKKLKLEIEVFIHGAMCVSISGRCFLSQFVFNKSANRGDCLQPCRRAYIVKDSEDGHELKLGNNCVMSPKDLCTIEFIDKLIEAGINAFKIEGRNRSPEYVKTVTECYREAIDAVMEDLGEIQYKALKLNPSKSMGIKKKFNKKLINRLLEKLKTVYNRGFSSGFFLGKPINQWTDAYGSKATTRKSYVGFVRNFYKKISVAEVKIESSGLRIGDRIMFQGKTTGILEQKINSMELNHKKIREAKNGQIIAIKTDGLVRKNEGVYVIS